MPDAWSSPCRLVFLCREVFVQQMLPMPARGDKLNPKPGTSNTYALNCLNLHSMCCLDFMETLNNVGIRKSSAPLRNSEKPVSMSVHTHCLEPSRTSISPNTPNQEQHRLNLGPVGGSGLGPVGSDRFLTRPVCLRPRTLDP